MRMRTTDTGLEGAPSRRFPRPRAVEKILGVFEPFRLSGLI